MKNSEKDFDDEEFKELDEMLYKYFENKKLKEVPLSVEYAIKHAFEKKKKHYIKAKITQAIIYNFNSYSTWWFCIRKRNSKFNKPII